MEVFSYAMAQPFKVILTMSPDEVKTAVTDFWAGPGQKLMSESAGGWTKVEAFKEHILKKDGVKVYYDIIWGWADVAVGKSGLRVENISAINVDKMSEDEGAVVSVVVSVVPKVKLGDYKNIRITAPDLKPTKAEVDGQVFLALNHSELASTQEIDKVLEHGDTVTLSYKCRVKDSGEEVDSRENVTVSLRQGSAAALTDSLVGEKTNSTVVKDVMLPESFLNKELAGKEVECEFNIGPVVVRNVPTPEQEAQRLGMSESEWVASIEADIAKNKLETFELRKRDYMRTEIEKVLLATSEIEPIPDSMIEKEVDQLIKSFAAARSKTVEEYLKDIKSTQDEMFRQLAPMAMRRIMVKLIVDAISIQEGIEPTEEKRDEYLQKYATESGKDLEEVRKGFEGSDISFLVKTFIVDELLCNSTTILPAPEKTVDGDSQPADEQETGE